MKIAPPPALTMTEASALYGWLSGSPYPKDTYVEAKAALDKVRLIAGLDAVNPSTQEKPK